MNHVHHAGERNPHGICQVCGREWPFADLTPAEGVRPSLVEVIRRDFPGWSADGQICTPDLSKYRKLYLRGLLEEELGELTALDQEVLDSLQERELLSSNISAEFERQVTFGERLADKIAAFGGSWTFIISFGAVLVFWVILNAAVLIGRAFDPYPFILLNLILSCLAALQAPVIMMSQNRVEARDRLRADNDYKVNLKAELEIRHLHEKLDHLIRRQWNRLFEIQQIQIELLENLNNPKPKGSSQTAEVSATSVEKL